VHITHFHCSSIISQRGDHVVGNGSGIDFALNWSPICSPPPITTYVDEIDAISCSKQNKCLFFGLQEFVVVVVMCSFFHVFQASSCGGRV
jgi:hypothetical protein